MSTRRHSLRDLIGLSFANRSHIHPGARYLDRLLVDDIDQANEAKEIDLGLSSRDRQTAPLASQGSERPATSRPQTGLTSLDFSAKASTRAAIMVAVADKFFLLSAVAALFEYETPAGGWPRTRDSCNIC